MFAKISDGSVSQFPYTADDLRRDNPNTSFPDVPSTALYAEFGVVPVVVTGAPEHDPATHVAEQNGCAYNAARQRWETQHIVRELTPAELAARVPRSVSMRQARLALFHAGLLQLVNDAVTGMPGAEGEAARIEWEYAAEVRRDSPLVASLAEPLSLSEADLDLLFVAAAVL